MLKVKFTYIFFLLSQPLPSWRRGWCLNKRVNMREHKSPLRQREEGGNGVCDEIKAANPLSLAHP